MSRRRSLLAVLVSVVALTACGSDSEPPADPVAREDITVGEHDLPGTLTTPADPSNDEKIMVVIVPGSGPMDQDGTIGAAERTPYRDIAEALPRHGISTVRFDKRTFALKTPESGETIQAETLDDVDAALQWIADNPQFADHRVFLFGHSLGAMVAPAILADHPDLAGAVLAAGTPRSLWDVIYDQNVQALEDADMPEAQKEATLKELRVEVDRANALTDPTAPPVLGSLPASYVVSLNELHAADKARELTPPVMVIHGSEDFQLSAEKDVDAWRSILPDTTRYEVYEGLDHLFMKSTGDAKDPSAYDTPGTVDEQVLADVSEWIVEHR